jgi:hypothetical protein
MPITVKHTKVSAIPDAGDANLVQPSDWNADHTLVGLGTMAEQNANNVAITGGAISGVTIPASNVTGTLQVNQGGTGATTLTGYVKGAGTTALTASSTIPNTDITGLGTASTKDAGLPLGVATLDAGGKVPISELPAAVLGALSYQGTWNANTNTPTLTSSTGTKGYYYVVSVAGNTNLDGITDWLVGDWAVYNGTVWQKVDNTETVTSVNGQTGAVVLTTTNIAEGTNEYFTQARARTSISAGTGISYDNTTGVITNSSPSLGGDVVGPASATDNAITRFDSTTGKLIQNSTVTLDDNGNIINANSLGLDTTPATVPTTVGTMSWDDGDGVPTVALKGGNVNLQVGTQQYARVYNDSGTTLTKGQVVYISGAQGNRVAVKLARADVEATSFGTIGLVAETMTSGAEGFIIVSGALYKLDTTGLIAGATVYVSPTTAGAVTTTKPQAPDQLVVVGWVERVDNIVGSIYVKIDNGYELDELHDVQITSPQSGNLLIYDATTTPVGVWKNANLTDGTGITITEGAGSVTITNAGVTQATAGTGISVSAGTGNVTITNTAPDQTVSLTGGTGISTSGTYPNFTITNTAPDQTVSLTGAGTTTVTGTYPNFTITSNDQYVGTVTSVAATAGTGISVTGSPITSSGTLTITNTAPDQVVAISAGTGISVSGTYPSFTVTNTAPAVNFTYTTNYIPYGQGTTTPNQSANFTYNGTTLTAQIVRASNGIVVNSKTVSASYTIASGDSATSAGPITVNSGVTVTVSSGSRWVVL